MNVAVINTLVDVLHTHVSHVPNEEIIRDYGNYPGVTSSELRTPNTYKEAMKSVTMTY